ncbi:MAG: cytochrome C [Paracoccaceae bacterium]|nr:cytochrome C [Paracoccaceae bacterium]MDE2915754.1 cytochrome C [Paracoccaceae bacterium]
MKRTLIILISAMVLQLGLGLPINAEGDPKKGERAFGQCKACHSVVVGESKRAGPNLFGVLGRKAGSADFDYSDVLIAAGETGLIWSSKNLDTFLSDPRKFLAEYMDVGTSQARTKKNH